MSRKIAFIVVALCGAFGLLHSQVATAASYAAPSPKGAFVAGPFSGGNFASPATVGLNSSTDLVQAISDAAGAVTVGVVPFAANSGQVTPAGGILWGSGGSQSPASTGDSNLNTLLTTETLSFGASPISGTASGLVSGRKYQLQLFIYDGDNNVTSESSRGTSTIVVGSDTLTNYNEWRTLNIADGTFTSSSAGFINYAFVATGGTINFSLSGGAANLLAGFDVTYLPEPGSVCVLMIIVGAGALSRRRCA